jgi:hypothetical protein
MALTDPLTHLERMTEHAVAAHEGFPDHDAAISGWLAQHGWPVTMRLYDSHRGELIWRASGSNPQITIQVHRTACMATPPNELVAWFEDAKLAESLVTDPEGASKLRGEADSFAIIDFVAPLPANFGEAS